jgi:hypothetical protein
MDLLKNTNVPIKKPGDGLSHSDINGINMSLNDVIGVVNSDIKNYCNINDEIGEPFRLFNFSDAVVLVPKSRRVNGTVIKYLDISGRHIELVFNYDGSLSTEISDKDWTNIDNWSYPFTEIDGGAWSISDDF